MRTPERKAQGRHRGADSALQHAAPDLIELDRFEQRTEVAFAEALITLALDDLEEDRPDDGGREDLEQHLVFRWRPIEEDPVLPESLCVFLVIGQARREQIVI